MQKSSLNHRFFRLDFARPNRLCFVSEGGKSGIERVDECEKPKNQINRMIEKFSNEQLNDLIESLQWTAELNSKD